MAPSASGWLTVKKRGRDDKDIRRDAEKAKAKRKAARQQKVGAKKPRKRAFSDDDEDEDSFIASDDEVEMEEESSDEEEEPLFSEDDGVFKTFRPAAVKKKTSSANPSRDRSKLKSLKPPALKQATSVLENLSNSEEKRPSGVAKKPQTISLDDSSTSSDEDALLNDNPLAKTTSNYFAAKPKKDSLQSLDDDDDDDQYDEPTPKLHTKKKAKANRKMVIDDEDGCSDEDEAAALAWAIAESQKMVASQNKSYDEPEEDHGFLVDSDEERQSEAEEEEPLDHEAIAAVSILDTANELSAQVLRAMTAWTQGRSDSQDSANSSIPTGMIVDGAVALSTLQDPSGPQANSSYSWISREEMSRICPNVKLADYQLIGVNWLALLHGMQCKVEGTKRHTPVNGVLADEMGLGKTVQTISFLAWLKHTRMQNSPDEASAIHLVIAPASVLSNWKNEFTKFAPGMNVVKYHGSKEERDDLMKMLEIHLPSRSEQRKRCGIEPIDVILSPVSYWQAEKSDDRAFLRRFSYDYLVVDEAHVLKNARSSRYRNLDRTKTQHRLLLTGTPVQNSPAELMALLCFLMPLFSRESSEAYLEAENDGGESMLRHFVSLQGEGAGSDAAAYRRLKQLFAPFVLRRKKQDVLSQILPPKKQQLELVPLDPAARSLYDSIIEQHVRAKKSGDKSSREHVFTQLRKASHHPLLLRTRHTSASDREHLALHFHKYGAFKGDGCTREMVAQELENYSDFDIHLMALELISENPHRRDDLQRYTLEESDLFSSSKFTRLAEILPKLVNEGHRILIFSVWTSCLDLLSCLLEHLDLKHLRMDGSTPVAVRQDMIDNFNRDTTIPIFLLSTNACGLGINLTAADVCIVHDLSFNPFNDLQAEDRCHRIGQEKPVTVIKLVSKDTVDEDIHAMQERKARMNAAIMENEFDKAKERDVVMTQALDRFLRSPQKENFYEEDDL